MRGAVVGWLTRWWRSALRSDWWVRSDWPLWVRVVDPDGEQARCCWLLRQLYRAPVIPNDPARPLTRLWV